MQAKIWTQEIIRVNAEVKDTYHLSTKSMNSSENFSFGNVGGGWKKNQIFVNLGLIAYDI